MFQNPFNFNPTNPLFQQRFGGFNNFVNEFNNFRQQFGQNAQMSPQQIIQQKIQNGEISQEQFNQMAQMANQMMGFFGGGKR
jgi:hypothetical protein